jgi:hypothetical protein
MEERRYVRRNQRFSHVIIHVEEIASVEENSQDLLENGRERVWDEFQSLEVAEDL